MSYLVDNASLANRAYDTVSPQALPLAQHNPLQQLKEKFRLLAQKGVCNFDFDAFKKSPHFRLALRHQLYEWIRTQHYYQLDHQLGRVKRIWDSAIAVIGFTPTLSLALECSQKLDQLLGQIDKRQWCEIDHWKKVLKMRENPWVTLKDVIEKVEECPTLAVFIFEGSFQITPSDIEHILKKCSRWHTVQYPDGEVKHSALCNPREPWAFQEAIKKGVDRNEEDGFILVSKLECS